MKMWKIFLIVLLSVVSLFIVIGLFISPTYKVSRSILINAPQQKIWSALQDFKEWPNWSPWIAADTTMKITYSDKSMGQGAKMSWVSEHSGEGSQVMTKVEAMKLIETELNFGSKGKAHSSWILEPKDQKVLVTWSFGGDMGYDIIGRYMTLLMDRFMGEFFEKGLSKLDEYALKPKKNPFQTTISIKKTKVDSTEQGL